jgi:hypothetical protein
VRSKLPEVIAVINRSVSIYYGFGLRLTQLLSILALYNSRGMLAQIGTGEGKTIINTVLTLIRVLEGHKVDIITSSPILAERDYREQRKFFAMFNVTSDANVGDEKNLGKKDCYLADVLYGTTMSFIGDILRTTPENNITQNRPRDIIHVDEVDSMFIDSSAYIVMLSRQLPRFEFLEPILVAIWDRLVQIDNFIRNNSLFIESAELQKLLHEYALTLVGSEDSLIKIPLHLKGFVKKHLHDWTVSAVIAFKLKKGADYTFKKQEDEDLDIAPVDRANTGVTQVNMELSKGIHQFLQIKHNLKISPEFPVIDFMSNRAFFEQYHGRIYGMTGTIGDNTEKEFLQELYDVGFITIPPFKPKKLVVEPMRFATTDWQDMIISDTIARAQSGRAVLLIAETMDQAEILCNFIIQSGYDRDKVRLYNKAEAGEDLGLGWNINSGDIIVSTNLSSRGVDFKTSSELEEYGGLHVCLTYLPENMRLIWQIYGRTCREGHEGSAQMILNSWYTQNVLRARYPWFAQESVALDDKDIMTWHGLAYRQKMLRDRLCEVPMMKIQDELFPKFHNFTSGIEKSGKNKKLAPEVDQMKELWGLWLEERSDITRCQISSQLDSNSSFVERNQKIKDRMFSEYEIFENSLKDRYHNGSLIENPSLILLRAYLNGSIEEAKRAVNLDPYFSFPAHYVLSAILISHNNRVGAIENLQKAQENINNIILPLYQLPGHLLTKSNISAFDSPLLEQFQDKYDILVELLHNIELNLNILHHAGQENTMLKVERVLALESVFKNHNKIKDELEELSDLGIKEFYEAGYEIIPERQGFWGNFFAIGVGICQIALGAAIPGGGIFLTSLSAGLVIGGVRDVITYTVAAVEGQEFNLDVYLKSKALDLAITVMMAGVETAAAKLGVSKTLGFGAPEKVDFTSQLVRQGKLALVTGAIEGVAKLGLRGFQSSIESHIRERVRGELHKHRVEVTRIALQDEWEGSRVVRSRIVGRGRGILAHYGSRYDQVHQQVLRSIGGRIPMLAGPLTALDVGVTINDIMSVTNEFCDEFGKGIADYVPSDESLFNAHLKSEQELGYTSREKLVYGMYDHGFIEHRAFTGHNVTSIEETEFAEVTAEDKAKASESYDTVASLSSAEAGKAYEALVEDVVKEVGGVVSNDIIRIIRSGIILPLSAVAGSYVIKQLDEAQKVPAVELKDGQYCDATSCWDNGPFISKEEAEKAKAATDAHQKEDSVVFNWDKDYTPPSGPAPKANSVKPANDNNLKSREEFEKHFLSRKEWKIHLEIGNVDKTALKNYIDAKYKHYQNGQAIDSIDVTMLGFEAHKFNMFLNNYAEEFPKTANFVKIVGKNIGEGISYVADKVGGALSVAGTALGEHLNEEVSFTPEHGVINEDHAVNILEPIIKPIHEMIVEFTNDLTPDQLELLDKAEIGGNVVFAGGVIKEIGKNYLFSSISKTLTDGARKNLDTAIERTVLKLDVEYRANIANREIQSSMHAPKLKDGLKLQQVEAEYHILKTSTLESFEKGVHSGHTIELHVGKTFEELIVRLSNEPNLKYASSFTDLKTAEYVYKEIIKHREKEIMEWIADITAEPNESFQRMFDTSVGYSVLKDSNQIVQRNQATIVLIKTEEGIKLLTSYPGE